MKAYSTLNLDTKWLFAAVLRIKVTLGSSTMRIIHTLNKRKGQSILDNQGSYPTLGTIHSTKTNNNKIKTFMSFMLPMCWSYCSWIYNYLFNQCLSPLKLWVRTPLLLRFTDFYPSFCIFKLFLYYLTFQSFDYQETGCVHWIKYLRIFYLLFYGSLKFSPASNLDIK